MSRRRKKTVIENKTPTPTITAQIPKIPSGQSMKVTNLNGNYVLSEMSKSDIGLSNFDYVAKSTYDTRKVQHIYNQVLDNEVSSFVTTAEELSSLAKNTQNHIDKVIKINGIIKYYINKDNLIGRVVEIIENNINNKYSINYNYVPKNKKDTKIFEEYKNSVINVFNEQIDIPQLILDTVLKTYTEGNYIFYLKGDLKNGYGIVNYPLDMVKVTSMIIDGEPVVSFKVNELSSKLNSMKTEFSRLKTNKLIDIESVVEAQIKRDYPNEVYDAYAGKDQVALLNPKNIGLVRINNLKTGLYGVSPIFKSLSSLLTLETIDKSDREILNARSKKIYYQKTRKELMDDGNPLKVNEVGYSHTNLLQCMNNNTIVYTSMPFVEGLEILEPKTELTNSQTKESYVMNVLTALGISFVSSEGSTSITTVKMVFTELIKMINRISKQLEPIINKYYREVTVDNGYPVEFAPKITIESTEMMDIETRLKIVDLIYSKLGLSYQSTLDLLGMNYQEELNRRKVENEQNVDTEIFLPHSNSYTSNSNELLNNNGDSNTNSNGSKRSDNIDRNEYDQQRQEINK